MRIFTAKPASSADRELLAGSGLFDAAFYRRQYPDVAAAKVDPVKHYLKYGATEGRRPHPAFDGNWYLSKNPDVRRADLNPLVHYLREGAAEGRQAHKRTAIYTAIAGACDDLRVPLVIDPEIDYFVFADEQLRDVPVPWIRRPIGRQFATDRLTSRFVKAMPYLHLPEFEISLWVDGAYQLRDASQVTLDAMAGSGRVAVFRHPARTCAYAEAQAVRERNLDSPENVARAIQQLKDHGYPEDAGLCENGLLFRRHRDPCVISAMEQWWKMISTGSSRDQISFLCALWMNRVDYFTFPGYARRNKLAYWMGHRPKTESEIKTRLLEHERELLSLYQQIEDAAGEPQTPLQRVAGLR